MKKYDWRAAILNEKSTIKDAIKSLIYSSLQIVLVVSSKSKLIGTVTDGDIRRGILSNLKLTESILNVIKKNPLVVTSEIDSKTVKYMMSANSLLQLPIVDKKRRIVGLHLWNDYIPGDPLLIVVLLPHLFPNIVYSNLQYPPFQEKS